jgi:hypothetical protein
MLGVVAPMAALACLYFAGRDLLSLPNQAIWRRIIASVGLLLSGLSIVFFFFLLSTVGMKEPLPAAYHFARFIIGFGFAAIIPISFGYKRTRWLGIPASLWCPIASVMALATY